MKRIVFFALLLCGQQVLSMHNPEVIKQLKPEWQQQIQAIKARQSTNHFWSILCGAAGTGLAMSNGQPIAAFVIAAISWGSSEYATMLENRTINHNIDQYLKQKQQNQ